MILHLGSGDLLYGDICVDIQFSRHTSSQQLYDLLSKYGLTYNPNAKRIQHNLNQFPYPFEDNSADKVFIIHTLEHLEYPLKVLQEVYRILKPNGEVIIVIPNPLKNEADKKDTGHIYSWTIWSIKNLLEYVGYKNIDVITIMNNLDILAKGTKV